MNYKTAGKLALLGEAFDDLQEKGMIARENYTCCQSCGWRAIEQEARDLRAADQNCWGAAFYHGQDAEDIQDSERVHISFGTLKGIGPNLFTREEAGEILAQALQEHGLHVEWDGSAKTRVLAHLS